MFEYATPALVESYFLRSSGIFFFSSFFFFIFNCSSYEPHLSIWPRSRVIDILLQISLDVLARLERWINAMGFFDFAFRWNSPSWFYSGLFASVCVCVFSFFFLFFFWKQSSTRWFLKSGSKFRSRFNKHSGGSKIWRLGLSKTSFYLNVRE